ncbi:hypothetical protein C0991_011927, partial [Blastosporella zonata]
HTPRRHQQLDDHDVDMAAPIPTVPSPPLMHLATSFLPSYDAAHNSSRPYSGGASYHHTHPEYRHTSPRLERRHQQAPFPPNPSDSRRSHTPISPEEEDIGSSDSSSNTSDYSEDDASDQLADDDDNKPPAPGGSATGSAKAKSGGFGFSAATWSSSDPNPNAPLPSPAPTNAHAHPSQRAERKDRDRDRPRNHYEEKPYHPPRYYTQNPPPPTHHTPREPPAPSSFTTGPSTREHRAYSNPMDRLDRAERDRIPDRDRHPPYTSRRPSLSPERSYTYPSSASYRRPVSPEPLYKEYREYRENKEMRHYREREREREREARDREREIHRERVMERERERIDREMGIGRDRDRERDRSRTRSIPTMTTRSSQTSPVRVESIHTTMPRSFFRVLTPSRQRRRSGGGSPIDLDMSPRDLSPLSEREREHLREKREERERERERDRKIERDREEREEREREREREKQREIQRAKYQYESRVPPPPPSLSAPITLRAPPPPPSSRDTKPTLNLSRGRAPSNPTANGLSSNAHTLGVNAYPPSASAPNPKAGSKRKARGAPPAQDMFAPPRMVLPGPSSRKRNIREEEDYDLGEDEVDESEDEDEYRPMSPPPLGSVSSAPVPRRNAKGSAQGTFSLGPSAPTNNNGATSTTTTFHVTTPRAISASLAAASSAAAHHASSAIPGAVVEVEKVDAEKMRIPSFKRGGKTRYQCVYCQKDFSRKNDAYRHMSRKHNDNATEFICVCGRVLSRGDALTRHMRTCRESKEKGITAASFGLGGGMGGGMGNGGSISGMGRVAKKNMKGGKKRRVGSVAGVSVAMAGMDVDGEEEGDEGTGPDHDVSMEEED